MRPGLEKRIGHVEMPARNGQQRNNECVALCVLVANRATMCSTNCDALLCACASPKWRIISDSITFELGANAQFGQNGFDSKPGASGEIQSICN